MSAAREERPATGEQGRDGSDAGATDWGTRKPLWPGASQGLPPVEQLEALGMAIALYLPTLMEERPDPGAPDGPPLVDAELPHLPHLLEADGTLGTGLLATLVDNVGGMVNGLASLPEWIVTTNLALRRPAEAVEVTGPLAVAARVLRRGRASVVSEVQVRTGDGRPVGEAWMTSAVLHPEMGPPPVPRPLRRQAVPTPDQEPYRRAPETFFAVDPAGPGEVRIDAPPRLRNPWGIVHGGALAVAADAAARHAVAHPTGIDAEPSSLVVTDLVLHYLSPARVGPVVARGTVVGDRGDDHLVRVAVSDHGADDRPVVLAVATVRQR